MKLNDHIRLFLLWLISGIVFAVLFSWSALGAAQGRDGKIGEVALRLSNFPNLVHQASTEALSRVRGEEDYKFVSVPRPEIDITEYTPLVSAVSEDVPKLLFAGQPGSVDRGWRIFSGAFSLESGVENAAVLVDPDFVIRRVWPLHEDATGGGIQKDNRKIVHGLQITRAGDLVVTFDGGASLQRIGACGESVWAQRGIYHHAVTMTSDGRSVWTLRLTKAGADAYRPDQEAFVRHDIATGETLKRITIADVITANSRSGLLLNGVRDGAKVWSNTMKRIVNWEKDAFHFNDIDPLPADIATAFPDFEAGDLLISSRTLSAVFVISPDTLRIKWHLAGHTHRQHDPDWWPDGRIAIYDNRMGVGPSRIIAVDPRSGRQETVVEGAEHGFYSRIRGKHMHTARGDLAITSPQQGRAFDLSGDDMVAEFYNLGPDGSGVNLALTEYIFIPEDNIDLEDAQCNDS